MIRLSWSTFRERWQLFVGAVVAVAVGVALVQASLLTVVAAAVPTIPEGLSTQEELVLRDGYAGAVTISAIIVALSTFVTVFVVGSTFAFTVDQRRRDFALLRLLGASPRKVRRLLYGEAILLGATGTLAGSLLGLAVGHLQADLLEELGCVPSTFVPSWHWWVLAVSVGVGIGVALLGSVAASRRAARVRPLDAFRQVGEAERVMSVPRWIVGGAAAAGAGGLAIAASSTTGNTAMDAALPGCMLAVFALVMLAPAAVPLVSRALEAVTRRLLPRSRLSELVHANLRDGVRRSASTATPVILLVGLVVGLAGSIHVIDAGRREEAIRTTDGQLVVETTSPIGPELSALDGVELVDEEAPILIEGRVVDPDGASFETMEALAAEPDAFASVHHYGPATGSLADLHGDAIAVAPSFASRMRVGPGDTTVVRLDGEAVDVNVAAVLPETMTGPDVLLSSELGAGSAVDRHFIIQTSGDEPPSVVAQRIEAALPGLVQDPDAATVSTLKDWLVDDLARRREQTQTMIVAILGLVALYIVIAVVNAVVIAAADRHEEFAVARLTGLGRAQLVGAAVWESLAVVAIGLTLGGAAAGITLFGVAAGVSDIVGTRITAFPSTLALSVAAGVTVLVATTSAIAALAATRSAPIAVAGSQV